MKTNQTAPSRWQKFVSGLAMFAVASITALSFSGCGGSSSSADPPPTVAAPAAPTALTATAGENVVTLQWSPPAASTTAGLPVSYEIYRSTTATTAETIVDATNFVTTTPVVDGQTVYSLTDLGLAGTTTYYFVVTAKNAGGETASPVASAKPTGPPNPVVAGNNFSAALIFADDIGITNLPITGVWTGDKLPFAGIDYNTGLRPLAAEVTAFPVTQLVLPYLPVASKIEPLYYEQKSINTWQGEWAKASGEDQLVTAKWGDNLAGTASLSSTAKIRIEMALTKDVTATPMKAYEMKLLSGSGTSELQGTTGVTKDVTTAFVMATNARLTLQKLDDVGAPTGALIVNQALFDPAFPDGLNKLSGEIPVSGNFTYGFVWDPKAMGVTAGKYRVTFKLDPTSPFGGTGVPATKPAVNIPNNTFIQAATNGVRVSDTEVYIDINVK